MTFDESPLSGAYVLRLQPRRDDRGYFARAWCGDELAAHGLCGRIAQINVGFSPRRGTLRGLHYQLAPHAECKLVRCTRGAVQNVIVDLRPESPTRGRWFAVELSAENLTMVYSPEGFANGYQTLSDDAEVTYSTTQPYAPSAARGVRFDDPALAIDWPLPVACISEADRAWPDLDPAAWPCLETASAGAAR
jgi:dTDP-4-dehydrorhamnose 3,5-epimerase